MDNPLAFVITLLLKLGVAFWTTKYCTSSREEELDRMRDELARPGSSAPSRPVPWTHEWEGQALESSLGVYNGSGF